MVKRGRRQRRQGHAHSSFHLEIQKIIHYRKIPRSLLNLMCGCPESQSVSYAVSKRQNSISNSSLRSCYKKENKEKEDGNKGMILDWSGRNRKCRAFALAHRRK